MLNNMIDAMKARRSVRTFDGRPLSPEHLEELKRFASAVTDPFGAAPEFRFVDTEEQGGSSAVIVGSRLYVCGKVRSGAPHCREAFGFAFEKLLLRAVSLGVGTVWLAGTFDRKAFEKAIALGEGELMPAVSPLGYAAKKMSVRETLMRKGTGADKRLPFEALFFDGSFDKPLTAEAAGELALPLEMVRTAPSAVNKQPWRILKQGKDLHFYMRETKGYGEIQRLDMGIALCHFVTACEELGIPAEITADDPGAPCGELIYAASVKV